MVVVHRLVVRALAGAVGPHEADRALRVAGARLDREAIHVCIVP